MSIKSLFEAATTPTTELEGSSEPTNVEPIPEVEGLGPETAPFVDMDPASLSPEDQSQYANMQSAFTRKTQELAEKRKEYEESIQKAQALDRLLTDPQYRAAVFGAQDAVRGDPTANAPSAATNPYEGVNVSEVIDQEQIPAVEAIAYQVIQRHLIPQLDQYRNVIDSMYRDSKMTEWNGLVSRYPAASSHLNSVSQFLQTNPNVTMEQALFAVAGADLVAQAPPPTTSNGRAPAGREQLAQGAGDNGRRPGVPLTSPGTTSSRVSPAAARRSLSDIVREALNQEGVTELPFGSGFPIRGRG